MILNDINFDGGERDIYRDCVDEIGMGGNSYKLNNVGDSTVSGTI